MFNYEEYKQKLLDLKPNANAEFPALNHLPYIISSKEWNELTSGLIQRKRALEAFLSDVYGDRRAVQENIIPQNVIDISQNYFSLFEAFEPKNGVWNQFTAADIVKVNGKFVVVEENVVAPGALSRIVFHRRALVDFLNENDVEYPKNILDAELVPKLYTETMRAFSSEDFPDIAMLTPGIGYPTYYDHIDIQKLTGITISTKVGFEMCEDGLYQRINSHTLGVKYSVLQRRSFLEDADSKYFPNSLGIGFFGLYDLVREGKIVMVNNPGGGIAGEQSIYPYVDDFIKFYLEEEPILDSIKTYTPKNDLDFILENLPKLVTKPIAGSGGVGVLVGENASLEQLETRKNQILENPTNFIAQNILEFDKEDVYLDGKIEQRYADLRVYLFSQDSETHIPSPGAICRFSASAENKVVNLSQGGGAKDVWVVE